jgi:hypothetical protein
MVLLSGKHIEEVALMEYWTSFVQFAGSWFDAYLLILLTVMIAVAVIIRFVEKQWADKVSYYMALSILPMFFIMGPGRMILAYNGLL